MRLIASLPTKLMLSPPPQTTDGSEKEEESKYQENDNDGDEEGANVAATAADLKRTLVDAFVFLMVLVIWCIASPLLAASEFQSITHAFRVLKVGTSSSLPVRLPLSAYAAYELDDDTRGPPCIVLLPQDDNLKGHVDESGIIWKYSVVYFKNEVFDSATRLRVVLARRPSPSFDFWLIFWNGKRIVAEARRSPNSPFGWDIDGLDVSCDGYKGVVGVAVLELKAEDSPPNVPAKSATRTRGTWFTRMPIPSAARVHLAVAKASLEARVPSVRLASRWISGDVSDETRWNARFNSPPFSHFLALTPSFTLLSSEVGDNSEYQNVTAHTAAATVATISHLSDLLY